MSWASKSIAALLLLSTCSGNQNDDKNPFSLLDLEDLRVTLSPKEDCSKEDLFKGDKDGEFGGLILVHSAPGNKKKREAIRETWGAVKGYKRVFLLGLPEEDNDKDLQTKLDKESSEHGDILQASFQDSYKNMTYKHLLGYRYASESCRSAPFLLKTDDDVAVDTFHLRRYLKEYLEEEILQGKQEPLFLCNFRHTTKPIRDPTSKWFVPSSEFPLDRYPLFCSGFAYVATVAAVDLVLKEAEERKGEKFWIDDVFVTGILRPPSVSLYDWSLAHLHTHDQYTYAVFNTHFFTPELMVAEDLEIKQMRGLFVKFREGNRKGWPALGIYDDQEKRKSFRPVKYDSDADVDEIAFNPGPPKEKKEEL